MPLFTHNRTVLLHLAVAVGTEVVFCDEKRLSVGFSAHSLFEAKSEL